MPLFGNNANQAREDEKLFVKEVLIRRFKGDHTLVYRDLGAFMETSKLQELLDRYAEWQDAVHNAFLEAGFGVPETEAAEPEIALEVADPDLEIEIIEEVVIVNQEPGLEMVSEEGKANNEPVDAVNAGETEESMKNPEDEETGNTENPELTPQDGAGDPPSDENHDENEPMEMKPPATPPVLPVKLNLPNGKTGVEYIQKIDISPLQRNLAALAGYESTGFEEIGLKFTIDNGELVISGTPTDHGRTPVTVLLHFEQDGDRPAQDYRLQGEIDILPDPRKMWKEIEPDSSLPYQKPHLRADSLLMAGRTMIAASRRGRSHAHSGTFRDDEFELSINEPQSWYIMAVADGAGSAPYSRRGSQIAVEKAVEVLSGKLDERLSGDLEALAGAWSRNPTEQLRGQIRGRLYECLSHAAYAGYKAIIEEAEAMGETPKAFHTTLMVTIVRQFDFGYFIGTWWVGDGAVGILREGKYLKVMGTPDGGQFAGQTRFLTMPEIWADGATVMKRIEFDIVEDFTAVMLMTDGVSDPKFHTDHNLMQLENWDKLWEDLSETVDFINPDKASDQLLDWLDFWAAGEHDDRTIAILF